MLQKLKEFMEEYNREIIICVAIFSPIVIWVSMIFIFASMAQ